MDVVIIGGGAAGLAAAYRLCRMGAKIAILEASERVGGRVHTVSSGLPRAPFELGAEFVHGTKNVIWEFLRLAQLGAIKVPDSHWVVSNSEFRLENSFFLQLDDLLGSAGASSPDVSFNQWLRSRKPMEKEWLARQFVEGFYAADPARISTHFMALGPTDSEQFRVQGGYGQLMEWLQEEILTAGGMICSNTVVEEVRWQRGSVEASAQTPEGQRSYHGDKAIVTLPLGVLKARPGILGAVRFLPQLDEKKTAIAGLEMGKIVKVQLRFGSWFWKGKMGVEDFGFIHSEHGSLRTWWSQPFAPILTGWVGGETEGLHTMEIVEKALQDLSVIFQKPSSDLKRLLQDWRFHDWRAEPFSRGSYSYSTVGHARAPETLAKPMQRTLFFAGEATVIGAPQGTVHGALSSGFRAADEILEAGIGS